MTLKPSDDEAAALEFYGTWSTSSLPLLPDPFWLRVAVPDKVLSIGQIEQTVSKQMTDVKLWLLQSNKTGPLS